MNTRPNIESPNTTQVLSVSFNNDSSCFAVGLNSDFNAGVGLVQMMGTTNYLALVGGGKLPKFASHKLREAPNLVSVYETADNLSGLVCLNDKVLAFPGQTMGQIQLVDTATGNVSIIPAHSSALRAIQISPDGELLATASDTGTIIRVFATGSCAKVAELRRGIDPATIFSLAFSPSGTMLACTSDKSTLHIFDVPHPKKPPRKPANQAPAPSTVLPGAGDGDGRGNGDPQQDPPPATRLLGRVLVRLRPLFSRGRESHWRFAPLGEPDARHRATDQGPYRVGR
ncbi:unnamed protein product [Parascedosporium putredinis]|uniref:WD40 repeat-like protein n=1 Tax=Parascedosporium putredinis TaxID=1442378 RepID=A0A9P1M7F0_9PEZI|nr:unnamed protein product [Parascedosporium putredinis]CAI7988272.1 unnamed protein product [Parascedosporium putredinis]